MMVRLARKQDLGGFLDLAAQVEQWFGPMVKDSAFHSAINKNIQRGTALVAVSGPDVVGGLLFSSKPPIYCIRWLVVSAKLRREGVGRALVADATRRFVQGPGTMEVTTFGPDHPGAVASRGRIFYEGLGYSPAEAVESGPDGGSRQVYRRAVT
jgi:GNAT superfamily N-acetyltransferase